MALAPYAVISKRRIENANAVDVALAVEVVLELVRHLFQPLRVVRREPGEHDDADEAGQQHDGCNPAQRVSALHLTGIHRLAVGKNLAQQEARSQAAKMRPVIKSHEISNDENRRGPGDQPGAQSL